MTNRLKKLGGLSPESPPSTDNSIDAELAQAFAELYLDGARCGRPFAEFPPEIRYAVWALRRQRSRQPNESSTIQSLLRRRSVEPLEYDDFKNVFSREDIVLINEARAGGLLACYAMATSGPPNSGNDSRGSSGEKPRVRTTALFDEDEVRRTLAILIPKGSVFEIRALNAQLKGQRRKATVAGYFDDVDACVAELRKLASASGIYFTMNPVDPALLARCANRLAYPEKSAATNDQHIVRRHCLLFDVDFDRASGISATDAEKERAHRRAIEIFRFLQDRGWSRPIVGDSGNGFHLLYRIDLPCADGDLIKRVLAALADRFDGDGVKLDRAVFNPARIVRLYGTLAAKGDNTRDRPHRLSRLLKKPLLAKVTEEQLTALVQELQPDEQEADHEVDLKHGVFDVDDFLARYGVAAEKTTKADGTINWTLKECPFNPDHKDAAVYQEPDGKLGFHCFHSSCAGRHWKDFRRHFEPETTRSSPGASKRAPLTIRTIDEILGMEFDPADLVSPNGYLTLGDATAICGPGGIGKTRLTMQLGMCCRAGRDFLGWQTNGQELRFLFLQTENSSRRLQADLEKMLSAFTPDQQKHIKAGLFFHTLEQDDDGYLALDFENQKRIEKAITDTSADVIICDPLRDFSLDDLNSDKVMDETVRDLCRAIKRGNQKRLPLIVHHAAPGKAGAQKTTGWDRACFGRNSKVLQMKVRAQINMGQAQPNENSIVIIGSGKANNAPEFAAFAARLSFDTMLYARDDDFDMEHWRAEVSGTGSEKHGTATKGTIEDLLNLIPPTGSISQNALLTSASDEARGEKRIAQKKARTFLAMLVEQGRAFEWRIKRPKTNPEIKISRHEQPLV
jgi:AAA domain